MQEITRKTLDQLICGHSGETGYQASEMTVSCARACAHRPRLGVPYDTCERCSLSASVCLSNSSAP